MATRFGYSSDEICANTSWWRDRIHPEDRARACNSIDAVIAETTVGSWTCEYRFVRRDGTYAEVCDRAYVLREKNGRAVRVVGAVMDLSDIKEAYRALQESEERYRYTIDVTGQIAWTANSAGDQVQFDERWSALTGLDCLVTADSWASVAHPDDLEIAIEHWRECVESGEALDVEHRIRVADGSFRWFRGRAAAHKDVHGRVERWYGTIEDIHERKLNQLALKRLASIDELTSLRNRHSFSADLGAALGQATDRGVEVGLLLLDIDDFKSVNDLFGHNAGDNLLTAFAKRMADAGLDLYRTGGDEFAAIVHGPTRKVLYSLAKRIHAALQQAFALGGTVIDCRTSIGCAVFPAHGNCASELLKSADIALYSAKAAGRGQTRLFASAMRTELQKRSSMLEVAKRALAAGDISAYFQPKISLWTGNLIGFEALMRIRSERFGPQHPAIISAAFDHPELVVEIADQILGDVISAAKRWHSNGLSFGRIALNASPLEFRDGDYADRLLARLAAAGVPADNIEVEVTETVFLGGHEQSILQSLRRLEQAGVTIALDDFGTGYASLSHLRQYPVNVLKIDQSFVRDLTTDSRQQQITKALIDLSRTMGIQTVAEGVETVEQAQLLSLFGCDVGQGFLFGRALTASDAEDVLRGNEAIFRTKVLGELRSR